MDTFGLKIISSDRVFYEGRCRKMIVPVPDGGGMEILPHHEDMVIAVVIGEAMLQFEEGEWVNLAVGAGDRQQPCDDAGADGRETGGYRCQTCPGADGVCRRKASPETEYTGILPDTGFAFKGDEPVEGVEAKKMVNRKQIYVEARNLLQIARFFNTEFLTKFIGKNGTIFYKIKVPIQGSLW